MLDHRFVETMKKHKDGEETFTGGSVFLCQFHSLSHNNVINMKLDELDRAVITTLSALCVEHTKYNLYTRIIMGEFDSYLLGDRGYPSQPYWLTPYPDPGPSPQQHYNLAHCRK